MIIPDSDSENDGNTNDHDRLDSADTESSDDNPGRSSWLDANPIGVGRRLCSNLQRSARRV